MEVDIAAIDGRIVLAGGGVEIRPCPYEVPTGVTVDVVPGRRPGPIRGDGLMQWTFVLEHALLDAGVDRVEALAALPQRSVSALGTVDGWAVAGSHRVCVAAGVVLDDAGGVRAVKLVVAGTDGGTHARRDVISGAYMGLGAALTETVPIRDGVPTPGTIRSLGLLRSSQTPPFSFLQIASEPTSAAVDAYATAAVPAAVANAVRLRFGDDASVRRLPMLDSRPTRHARRRLRVISEHTPRKEVVKTSRVHPLGPYSVAVRSGGLVYLAGQVGWDYEGHRIVGGGIETETRKALENIGLVLADAGLAYSDVLRCTVYLTDLADWPKVNEIWGEYFPHLPPARSAVGVAALPAGASIEIEATAAER